MYSSDRTVGSLRGNGQSFPNSWAYVAELLQNAIDESATHIRVEAIDNTLIFEHNGGVFAAHNVEALCSQRMSSKGVGTVGFMGLGFKSVFLRYQKASISSAGWRFFLRVSSETYDAGERIRNWRGSVLPFWDDGIEDPSEQMTCRFVLSERMPDAPAVMHDLDKALETDRSLLVQLARRGIRKLEWNGTSWHLSVEQQSFIGPKGKEVEMVLIQATTNGERRAWRLFSARYSPGPEALKRFLEHRQLTPPEAARARKDFYAEAQCPRQVDAFIEVRDDGVPIIPSQGRLFAVLPMETTTPIRMHIQADWLLVVTRAEPKDLNECPWHAEIRATLPRLLAAFLKWLSSKEGPRAVGWATGYTVIPSLTGDDPGAIWLNHPAFIENLKAELDTLPFLPSVNEGQFVTPEKGWLAPQAFASLETQQLHPDILLGARTISRGVLGEAVIQTLQSLGLLQEMLLSYVSEYWEDGAVARWVKKIGRDKKPSPLVHLLAALELAGKESRDWRYAPLRCLPSISGTWLTFKEGKRFPSDWDSVSGEKDITEWLLPHVGHADELLQWEAWQDTQPGSNDQWTQLKESAREYLKKVHADPLEAVVARWWDDQDITPNTEAIGRILRVTSWVRNKRLTHTGLVRKVLALNSEGTVQLLSPEDTVLAEPYADGFRRRILSLPSIVEDYWQYDGPSELLRLAWSLFLFSLGPQGEFSFDIRRKAYSAKELRARLPQVKVPAHRSGYIRPKQHPVAGTVAHNEYVLVEAILPRCWHADPSYELAKDLSDWLAASTEVLAEWVSPRVFYIPYGSSAVYGMPLSEPATWISQLRKQRWIPVKGSKEVLTPSEILPKVDPLRPEAPVADIKPQLLEALMNVGLKFGVSLPATQHIKRLQVLGGEASHQDLRQLISAAIEEAREDEAAQQNLVQVLQSQALLPGSPVDESVRVPHGRLVARVGRQSRLGGWIVSADSFEAGSVARSILDMVDAFYPFAATTTAVQTLEYLHSVWTTAPDAEEVRLFLPLAYEHVLDKVEADPELAAAWATKAKDARVFVKGMGWFPAREAYFPDLLIREHALYGEFTEGLLVTTAGHLGKTVECQRQVAALLGLRSLSTALRGAHRVKELGALDASVLSRLSDICDLVACIESSGALDDVVPLYSIPPVKLASSIMLELTKEGSVVKELEVGAALEQGTIFVCGPSYRYGPELASVLARLWKVAERAPTETTISQLAMLLDLPGPFKDVLERSYMNYGLVRPSPKGEVQTEEPAGDLTEAEPDVGTSVATNATRQAPEGVRVDPNDEATQYGGQQGLRSSNSAKKETSARKDTSYTSKDVEARMKSLLTVDVSHSSEDEPKRGGPMSDETFRQAAMNYERSHGRYPLAGASNQPGYDIASYSDSSQTPDTLLRLIEVKGKTTEWDHDELVTLSRRQFIDALSHDLETTGWDYWLYVVQQVGEERFVVFPLRNPARQAQRYGFRGGIWRIMAEKLNTSMP